MSVMFRRKRSVLRSIINNNEKEGRQVCDITDALLFLQNKKCTNCREMNTMRGLSRGRERGGSYSGSHVETTISIT